MSEQTGAAEPTAQNKDENADLPNNQQSGESRSDRDRRGGGRHNRNRGGQNQGRSGQSSAQQTQQNSARNSLNMIELREITELIAEHGFTDFEFENESIRIRLRKDLQPQIMQAAPPIMQPQSASSVAPPPQQTSETLQPISNASAPSNVGSAAVDEDAGLRKITSPIVGTFYRAPSPEAEPFVKIGAQVSAESIVCIVEAMKLMNEIPAEITGEIVKIYIENGQPVEYGQPLFAVK